MNDEDGIRIPKFPTLGFETSRLSSHNDSYRDFLFLFNKFSSYTLLQTRNISDEVKSN